jgi:hypothetical protein
LTSEIVNPVEKLRVGTAMTNNDLAHPVNAQKGRLSQSTAGGWGVVEVIPDRGGSFTSQKGQTDF